MKEKKYEALLMAHNLKVTAPRLKVLEALGRMEKPKNIKEIIKSISNRFDQVTLYRILDAFIETGIVSKVALGKDEAYYELVRDDHHHLICTNCHKVSDVKGCDIESFTKRALRQNPDFKTVTNHSFELFGLCRSCVKK